MATSQTEPPVPGAPLNDSTYQLSRSKLLPNLNQFLLAHSDIQGAFPGICRRLHPVLPHEHAGMALYEAERDQLRLFAQQVPSGAASLPQGFTLPLDGTPAGEAYRSGRAIVVDDLRSPQFTCEATRALLRYGSRSGCWAPLRTPANVFGTLWISSTQPRAFRPEDAFLLDEAAGQIALALSNQLLHQQVGEMQRRRAEERDGSLDWRDIAETGAVGIVRWGEDSRWGNGNEAALRILGRTADEMQRGVLLTEIASAECMSLYRQAERELRESGLCRPFESGVVRPDGTRARVLVAAGSLGSRRPPWVAFVTDLQERRMLSIPPAVEAQTPITQELDEIAANSPLMHEVLRNMGTAAVTNTTMLLLGETGTGKEVLARAIWRMGPRQRFPLIKVNCAAIPAGLLESELFGHEKGAYTGAHCRKIGRLEAAHRGTLFLDEVGDVPLELQPKLLRVLQEREFERLGGTQTIKVDVRVIAATNRDLEQMTASGQFRRDLFYRLNVFPVTLPPLRERPESIGALVERFAERFSKQMGRPHLTLPEATLEALQRWWWPGNIRELENLIERAVILSPGPELRVNLDELRIETSISASSGETLLDLEREHIRHVLHDSNGVIGGKNGAASRLGLKRTTLQSKMKKLEIPRF